jgi:uncharacterized glyoxalase superfamily protein PhnB
MLSNRSVPNCTVIPVLSYHDVKQAADWLCDVFGFTVRLVIEDHRVQLNVWNGAVIVREGLPEKTKAERCHAVLIRVDDVHSHHEHAVMHGAYILREPTDYPYGERQYSVEDFAGHEWTFTQSLADVDPADWGGTPVQL